VTGLAGDLRERRSGLQAADWRFLLPIRAGWRFRHLVLLGDDDRLAARLLEMGAAGTVSHEIPPGREADAVVVLARLPVTARTAAAVGACLTPGGVVYWEIDRSSHGYSSTTPSRIRRALRPAGLSVSGMYAIRPNSARARSRHYLPLEVPGALSWYVEALHAPAGTRTWLFHLVMRRWPALGRRILLGSSRFLAVTATAGAASDARPSVLGHADLPAWLGAAAHRTLMLTDSGNRVVILPFAARGRRPLAIVKIPKRPRFNDRTENEHAKLNDLRSCLPERLRGAIPEPLCLLRHDGLSIAVESYLPGRSLGLSSRSWPARRRRQLADLTLAATWLGEFHARALVHRAPWGVVEHTRWVTDPCEAFRRSYGATDAEERLFAAMDRHAASLAGVPFPTVWLHRDFTPRNVLQVGAEPAVIDWEGCRPGPALCDLLHFVNRWYGTVRPEAGQTAKLERFRALWFDPHDADALLLAVRRALLRYCRRLDLDRRFLPVLLVYTFVELALRRSDQQRLQRDLRADVRAGNDNFGYIGVLAHQVDRLFGDGRRTGRQERAATARSRLAPLAVP
jgi:Ser/Thr protein kinase RdoA (MazF antagonist)